MTPRLFLLAPLAALLLPGAALAVSQSLTGETSRDWTLEFRMGSYRPDIDEQFTIPAGSQGPYEAVFGDDEPFMFLFGFDFHLVRNYGTLSLGPQLGIWSVDGKGIAAGEATDDTELSMYPLLFQATYKLDLWQDVVPLVPVARIGADYYVWEILDGSGDTAKFAGGDSAFGGTWGWHYTLGLYVLLDFFAAEMAADFDRDAGVNNSYLTVEYHSATVDDFGSDESFRLGGDTFFIGLALDL